MKRTPMMTVALVAAAVVAVCLPGAAVAAPPANDDFANAVAIDPESLPFGDSIVIDDATLESGEPSGCYFAGKSVWYRLEPTSNGVVRVDIGGSTFFDRIVYVYRQDGSGFGGLTTIACASPYYNGQSAATFSVEAGETYYVQAGGFYSFSAGTLNVSVEAILPPPNDDFESPMVIGSLPFQDDVDTTAATIQSDEPALCTPPASEKTVWYAYSPAVDGSVTARITMAPAPTGVAVYQGASLEGLTRLGCQYGFPLTFHVEAGATYYLQIGTFGQYGGQLRFVLETAPPPVAGFVFSPGDPSIFDSVQFFDQSYDPAGNSFSSEVWSFGDGTEASDPGCCPTHRYSQDGDYTVELVVTTSDGRAASIQQVVHVRTHDVTIAKVLAPQTASVGQSRTITVGLTNSRYPETVQVQLLKSVAGGGWQQVGVLSQYVPVRGANRTTNFSFNYTFTPDDAALGKVSFQAIASIENARDAIPADNTFISLPTKVR